jgi:glutamine amidotransferase
MVVIVDYKMGNVGSILNMLKKIGTDAVISADPAVIKQAARIVLPGVGSFDEGMSNLHALGLKDVLQEKVIVGRAPTLGICLGMQLFGDRSEEGSSPGLGWIHGEIKRFVFDKERLKVPHMGWNTVRPAKPGPMSRLATEDSRFYFVHAYHFVCADQSDVLFTSEYGQPFVSAVRRDNIVGVQFHPEKSHRFGMDLLRTFVGMRAVSD